MTKYQQGRSLMLLALGGAMMIVALMPFVQGYWQSFWQTQEQAVYPLALDSFLAKIEASPKILGEWTAMTTQPTIMDELDYGDIRNWFATSVAAAAPTTESYLLDIKKLKVINAVVKVGGTNIDHNLVQFNAEAKIGDFGTPVIFGHSILRQFYNPSEKNKDRYKGIFSTIMTLELGDEIKITKDGIVYAYRVIEKKEVAPDADYILAQSNNTKQIKLVTCVPEGTSLRRGVITAELI